MTAFRFASPEFLLLLLVLPMVYILLRVTKFGGRSASLRFANSDLLRGGPSWRLRLHAGLPWLRLAAYLLLILALARPQRLAAYFPDEASATDIVFALDVSNSMSALDIEPTNRLDAAKAFIAQVMAERPYARYGLVLFAHNAYIQSPLTRDQAALRQALAAADLPPKLGITDGTALGHGLASAANLLTATPAAHKIVILLTDGVETAATFEPTAVAVAVRQQGIIVYTIGLGKPGLVPFPQGSGDGVVMWNSPLDENTLRTIAETTGGAYYRIQQADDLGQALAEIKTLAHIEDHGSESRRKYRELFFWLALPAFVLLLLDFYLRQSVLLEVAG